MNDKNLPPLDERGKEALRLFRQLGPEQKKEIIRMVRELTKKESTT